MSLYYNDKSKLVQNVFNNVYGKYDLMNDIMSLGTHRLWKKNLISWVKPKKDFNIIDVAAGTGDIAKLCSTATKDQCEISCVEPNKNMLEVGKKKLKNLNNLSWILSPAENLPFENNSFDCYIISFGIRNVTSLKKTISEAKRVLKKGGSFYCLEFSKVENEILKNIYNQYSKIIPKIGKLIVGDEMPYEYLVKSINQFYGQDEFADLLTSHGFVNVEYRNLANGVAAIHRGWKI